MNNNAAKNNEIYELDIIELQANPLQPRGVITHDSLADIVESIREQGIIEPIVVAKTPAGFQIIAGERRWRAAKIVGLRRVPVIVKETTPQGMLEMSIVENVQREDLNPIEKALAYRRLIDEFGLGTTEVAKRVGKSVPAVSNTIRLLSLPDAIKDALVATVITEGHVRPLLSLGDPKLILDIFKTILKDNYTVRQTEELARKIKGDILKTEPKSAKTTLWIPEQDQMAKQIQEKYNADEVAIQQSGRQVKIVIVIKGDPQLTTGKLLTLHKNLTG